MFDNFKEVVIYGYMNRAHRNAVNKGFYDDLPRFGELIALLHSEPSEALEAYRENGLPESGSSNATHPITEEYADVFIRLMDQAEYLGLNLPEAIELKMTENESRPYKHGGKLL